MSKTTKPDTLAIWPENYEEIKASVRSLFSKDRATLKKRVEKMKKTCEHVVHIEPCNDAEVVSHNGALDKVLALLGDEHE